MLKSALRNRMSKGTDKSSEHQQNNQYSDTSSEDEYYDLKMEYLQDSDLLDEAEVHTSEKADKSSSGKGKETVKLSEDSNGNSLSESEMNSASNEKDSMRKKAPDQSAQEEKGFPNSEREIYEMQLVQLQEQLVATIISEQEKDEQLMKYQQLDIEKLQKSLKEEQEKNADLTDKLKILKNKVQNSKLGRVNASKSDPRKKSNRNSKNLENELNQDEEWTDISSERNAEDVGQEKEKSDDQDVPRSASESSSNPEGEDEDASSAFDLSRSKSVKDKPDGFTKPTSRFFAVKNYKNKAVEMIVERLWDFVNEETETTEDDKEEDALSVKNLKESINRFSKAIKPISNFIKGVHKLMSWNNFASTCLAFIVYMYAAFFGYLFSLVLLIAIWKLFMNYLSARGITAQIGLEAKEKKEETNDDKSLSDKFQLVLEVAKKVQNTLGKIADSLEKIDNLLLWQHPATNTLFFNICLLFIASLWLSGPTMFMFMALGFGIKIFILGPLYDKFPKVKKRYDTLARVWSELPSDADLVTREVNTADQNTTDASGSNGVDHNASGRSSQSWINFCEKMKIPSSENPLPSWEQGHRCTLINKDHPLTNMKHGRLYLTQNLLCFERNKSSKNIVIKLENILRASKCKPINMIPGTGMAIEIEVKGSNKPYIFAALLGRDDVFESLMLTGKAASYRWAC
ncbi:GRAM domain-containing protein 4-like [Actinia tenebrosa]|uniref:GRAM domain-containing protein 4-like n=1 Tax=Actinia tenebrosa TaxID=6105 RepID=A0A6P8IWY4_ACTTE|nr:GRAM domain-containing protein 4-like [Actinia tenebrosa]